MKSLKKLAKANLLWFLVGVFFLIVIGFLSFSSYFSIKNIQVDRTNFNVNSAAIESELNRFIGRNLIFFSRSKMYTVIHETFPEFETVDIHKVFPNQIRIELSSYPTVANLRAYHRLPEPEENIEEDFTELNKAIEELSDVNPGLNLIKDAPALDEAVTSEVFDLEAEDREPEETEQKSLLNQIGQAIFDQEENLELITIAVRGLTQPVVDRERIIPQEHMEYLLDAIAYFENTMAVTIKSADYLPVAREIHLKTDTNLVVWITIEREFREQIDKLVTIYETAELNKEKLSYIDLRIKEKIIYCPKRDKCDNQN